jgi:hypothetical protein
MTPFHMMCIHLESQTRQQRQHTLCVTVLAVLHTHTCANTAPSKLVLHGNTAVLPTAYDLMQQQRPQVAKLDMNVNAWHFNVGSYFGAHLVLL